MTIFGNFHFSPYGEPPVGGGIFCPLVAMCSCALIASLNFLECLGEYLRQFHAFINRICTILTVSSANGLDCH